MDGMKVVADAMGVAAEFKEMGMVGEPVDESSSEPLGAKDLRPVGKGRLVAGMTATRSKVSLPPATLPFQPRNRVIIPHKEPDQEAPLAGV